MLGVDPVKNLVVPRFLALMLVTGLFDVYALIFGVIGGIAATLVNHAPLGPFFATFFNNAETTDLWGSVVKTTLFGAIIAIVCCYKGMTASGGAEGVGRAVNQAVVIAFLGVFAFNYAFTQTLLATHPEITTIVNDERADHDTAGWIEAFGEMTSSAARMFGDIVSLRVFKFFGEALRQAGILVISSTLVIFGLVFIIGLECGIEGGYFTSGEGAPAYSGVFAAWCDLRELVPLVFGYMMAAKVGTGIVAELGSMRISDEIDALEVMGISGMRFPLRDPAAGGDDGAAVCLPVLDRRGLLRLLPGGRAAARVRLIRWLLIDLLAISEPDRRLIQLDKGDGDGGGHRHRWLLLRL